MYNKNQSGSPTKVKAISLPSHTRLNTTAKMAATVARHNNGVLITLYQRSFGNYYQSCGHLSVARSNVNRAFQTLLAQYPGLMQTTPYGQRA